MAKAQGIQTHMVAFRVTDAEWEIFSRQASREKVSVGRLAKELLFRRLGLGTLPPHRRPAKPPLPDFGGKRRSR
jgi:hypothetical protein